MRAATAYFASVGTVAVAIAAGLGGGLVLGNIMSPQQPKYPSSEVTRLEQRNPQQPIQAANGAQPASLVPAPQAASAVVEQPGPAQPPQQAALQQAASQPQAQPRLQRASIQPAEPPRQSERSATTSQPVAAVQSPQPAEQSAPRAAPEDSFARAREADMRREARRAEDRRKVERRQQWADRRKPRQHGDDDLKDVEAAVRADTEQRSFFARSEARPERIEPRQIFSREPSVGSGRMTLFDD
jgi:hypothetical protein